MTELGDHIVTDAMKAPAPKEKQPPASELCLKVAALIQSGADRFDPVRFRYLETMTCRALNLPASVALIVEKKARKALEDYQHEFTQAKADATSSAERVAAQFPDSAESIHQLFADSDFKAVKRLEAKLVRGKNQCTQNLEELIALTRQIIQDGTTTAESPKQCSFEAFLQQQEYDIVTSTAYAEDPSGIRPGNLGELKSVRRFRESWGKISSEKVVTRAINEGPENPGPLNQHMLAIRSLSTMRDLSPHYLNRFVSYMGTLSWLEQACENNDSSTLKKGGKKSKPKTVTHKKK